MTTIFIFQRGTLLCEPAIRVINKGQDCQVWTVEKLENRLADMREAYMEFKDNDEMVIICKRF